MSPALQESLIAPIQNAHLPLPEIETQELCKCLMCSVSKIAWRCTHKALQQKYRDAQKRYPDSGLPKRDESFDLEGVDVALNSHVNIFNLLAVFLYDFPPN